MVDRQHCLSIHLLWNELSVGPYLQVGGNQPLYFDQMTNIYNHYTVVKSRIKVTLIPNTVNPFVGGILTDDDGVPAYTSLHEMCEQPSSVYVTSQRDAQVVTLYKSWDCKAVFGPNPRQRSFTRER